MDPTIRMEENGPCYLSLDSDGMGVTVVMSESELMRLAAAITDAVYHADSNDDRYVLCPMCDSVLERGADERLVSPFMQQLFDKDREIERLRLENERLRIGNDQQGQQIVHLRHELDYLTKASAEADRSLVHYKELENEKNAEIDRLVARMMVTDAHKSSVIEILARQLAQERNGADSQAGGDTSEPETGPCEPQPDGDPFDQLVERVSARILTKLLGGT